MLLAIGISFCVLIWLVFDKLRLIPLTLPIAILLGSIPPLFFAALFFGMGQYHPSANDVMVLRRTVEIRPLFSGPGSVIEIAVAPNERVEKDSVLFRIDSEPFESEVAREKAALAAAEQNARQLEASVEEARARLRSAQDQLALAKVEQARTQELFEREVVAQRGLDQAQVSLSTAIEVVNQARAAEQRAVLSMQSTIGGVNTAVAQARERLRQAEANLEDATVTAPCDGFAVNMQLLLGAVVSSSAPVMTFVCEGNEEGQGLVVATFGQGSYRNISVGDYAEVVFKMYPGEVFGGQVDSVIDVTNEGQLRVAGQIPDLKVSGETVFAVVIKLHNADGLRLPAGIQGNAAVLTGTMQVAGVIRMALLRAQTWRNYVF